MDKNYESWSLEDIQAEIMHVRLIDLKREYELCMILSEKAKLSNDIYALTLPIPLSAIFIWYQRKIKIASVIWSVQESCVKARNTLSF